MGPKFAECTVKGDVGSDHLPVHIRLNSHEVEKALTKAVHRLDKANWQKFRKELKSIEMGDLTTPDVHQGTIFDDEFKVEVESTIKEHEMLFKPLVSHVPEEDDDHETPITTGEIKAYLKKCKSSSAPGLDGIRYGVLKQANDKVYEALANICNACMATG